MAPIVMPLKFNLILIAEKLDFFSVQQFSKLSEKQFLKSLLHIVYVSEYNAQNCLRKIFQLPYFKPTEKKRKSFLNKPGVSIRETRWRQKCLRKIKKLANCKLTHQGVCLVKKINLKN